MAAIKLHSKVLALFDLDDDGEVCRPGDIGEVIWLEPDGVPLVRFKRTGRASIVDPDTEIVQTSGFRALA